MKDWIRLEDITRRGKDPIALVATSLEELAITEAMTIIHGKEAGLLRYREVRGRVWFNRIGQPVIYGEVK